MQQFTIFHFNTQVDRMVEKAKASMEVQSYLVNELKQSTEDVDQMSKKFKHDAEVWAAKQIVKVWERRSVFCQWHFFDGSLLRVQHH